MSHVFISYKREDEARVGRLVQALKAEGLSPWWDRDLVGGEGWRELTQKALDTALCVIVVWTDGSVGPQGDFVRDEAGRAKRRRVLVPVLLDKVDPPLGFGEMQAWDMIGWTGGRRDPRFGDLCAALRAKLESRPAPAPKAPLKRLARRVAYGSLGSVAFVVAVVVGANLFGSQERLCSMPVIQPQLADACGTLGLGSQPTQDERIAWFARQPGSCAALRRHIERFPEGVFRRQAADLLAARRISTTVVWTPSTRNVMLLQPQDDRAHNNEDVARAAALALAHPKAERLCKSFAATTRFRLTSAHPVVQKWNCSRQAGGMACGFEGEAACTLEERANVEGESCGP